MKGTKVILGSLFVGILFSCTLKNTSPKGPSLNAINILDKEGMTEVIASKERLEGYERVNFLEPQPYQKVIRIYKRDACQNIKTIVTTYHPNGHLKQCLEVLNNRAFGPYKEWYSNGALKVEAFVIEGVADINLSAEKSWLFDGMANAFDECGRLQAEICYSKGVLEGESKYFHPNGTIWKIMPYNKNQLHGLVKVFLEEGSLLQTTEYWQGVKHGPSLRYWGEAHLSSEENYSFGKLMSGIYFSKEGKKISEIKNGSGFRALFGKHCLAELHQYNQGVEEGEIKILDAEENLIRLYHVKNGVKHGEEIYYFPKKQGYPLVPRLSVMWFQGKIQGLSKTWYENGIMESQKEMSENQKNGLALAWYKEGELMLIEEYEQGKLKKGDYFRKGEKYPVSQVINGEGLVTFFDLEGNYIRKVPYKNGRPDD